MMDMNQFFELYGKPGLTKTERANAEKELSDYFADEREDAEVEANDNGYDEGYNKGYDEGYESGKDDAENKEAA